jgi:ABC-type polar amino acid transport system ATPase subunit
MTMLLVTHEIGFAGSLANEIFFVEEGTILEQGPPKKILSNAKFERTRQFCAKIGKLNDRP